MTVRSGRSTPVAGVISGVDEASMLRRVLEGPESPDEPPAQIIHPYDGPVRWLVDGGAAAGSEGR